MSAKTTKSLERQPRIVTYKGKGRQPWRWKLVGGNGEPILVSEGYLTKWNRDRAVRNTGAVANGIEIAAE